jgi:ribonuclease G
VSQRIQDPQERARLQSLLESSLEASDWPDRRGFIVRTAATGAAADDLVEDLGHLHRLWLKLQERLARPSEVRCIYSEESLFVRVTRDLLSAKVTRIRIDNPEAYASLCGFLEDSIPEAAALTELVGCDVPLFESETDGENTIEQQILAALCKDVALPSGGDLVIEQTESMVTIDVNTGSFVGRSDQSATILATNLEAAVAIARQLKLRNLGGIIVIDFIDMESAAHREQVRKALLEALASDSARTVVGEFSQFGLVEMTRKRSRESLPRLLQKSCEICAGEGRVLREDVAS